MPPKVGFVVTPGEIANRIAALDDGIQTLRAAVRTTIAPKLDAEWKTAFEEFVSRWAVERDSYATWDSRLFATRVLPRLEGYEASYRAWRKQFAARSGMPAPVPAMRAQESLVDVQLGSGVWFLLALGVAVFAYTRGRR